MLGKSLYNRSMSESPEFAHPEAEPLELPDCLTTTETKVHCRHYWCHSGWKRRTKKKKALQENI